MKKIQYFLLVGILMLTLSSCQSKYKDLFTQTDYFVEQLNSVYESYGMQGLDNKKYTADGKYGIVPMGRLIIVRIEEYVEDKEYESLRKLLEKHYKNDYRVNQVYINQGGTVVVDCRN